MLARVELGDVDVDEANVRVLPGGLGGAGEVAVAGADADHQVGLFGDAVGRKGAGDADRTQVQRVIPAQAALAGHGFTHRDAGGVHELPQRLSRLGVDHAAAGHDHRLLAGPDQLGCLRQRRPIRPVAHDMPDALAEERDRVVVGLGLHILRQRQGHRAGLGRAGEHPQRLGQGGQQLIGPVDPVPILADRPEAVVGRKILAPRRLDLLQHRRHVAPREDVAGDQQHGQPVDGRRGCAGDHVRRARTDGRQAGEGLQAVLHLGVRARRVDRRLLVAHLVVPEVGVLHQRLADARHDAVAEDAEAAGEKRILGAVALDVLVLEESDEGLRHGEALGLGCHVCAPFWRDTDLHGCTRIF